MNRLAAGLACIALTSVALAQDLQVVEGKGPVFSTSGTTFAWGVLKGADEARTTVVVRVSGPGFRSVSAGGSDPAAGKREKVWVPRAQLPRTLDLRIARPSFTKYPRTAVRFYREERGVAGTKPELEVFFVGVPEGTREFSDAAELDRYLTNQLRPN
jgi:hypothetical protein